VSPVHTDAENRQHQSRPGGSVDIQPITKYESDRPIRETVAKSATELGNQRTTFSNVQSSESETELGMKAVNVLTLADVCLGLRRTLQSVALVRQWVRECLGLSRSSLPRAHWLDIDINDAIATLAIVRHASYPPRCNRGGVEGKRGGGKGGKAIGGTEPAPYPLLSHQRDYWRTRALMIRPERSECVQL